MEKHQNISGSGSFKKIDSDSLSVYADLLEDLKSLDHEPAYSPYGPQTLETKVLTIIQDGQRVDEASEGYEVEVILADTPLLR